MSKAIIINPGSTATKYAFFVHDQKKYENTLKNYIGNLEDFFKELQEKGLVQDKTEITACGMRTVHGADVFTDVTIMTDEKIKEFEKLCNLAPLHNPPALEQMKAVKESFGNIPLLAVFDTAFHSEITKDVYSYALNSEIAEKYKIRRYGFHGLACQSVLNQVEAKLDKIPENLIVCHLGGGCSITAVKNGKSVETSMGFTPLEGLMMITRTGDIDPGVILHLMREGKMSIDEVDEILNKKSGFKGFCDTTNVAEIIEKALKQDKQALLALNVFVHRLVKYIGAYTATLGGCDAITFSGGIGEGGAHVREMVLGRLGFLNTYMDSEKNQNLDKNKPQIISTEESKTKALVVPVQEDEVIYNELLKII